MIAASRNSALGSTCLLLVEGEDEDGKEFASVV